MVQGGTTTSYLYDAAGQRPLRKDSTGTTLYLPNGNELKLDKAGTVTVTRYYSADGQTVAMRTDGMLTFLASDHHGTSTTQVSADTTQAITRRKTGIFGEERGTQPSTWAGDKSFVGGTKDADTGLTHIGAREYAPTIGRFASVDPVLAATDPQSLTGYAYSNNNPVTLSDPDGLCTRASDSGPCMDTGGGKGSAAIESGHYAGDGCGGCASGGGGGYDDTDGEGPMGCGVYPPGELPSFVNAVPPAIASVNTRICAQSPIELMCNPQDAVLGGGSDDVRMIGVKWFLGQLDRHELYGEDSQVARQVAMTSEYRCGSRSQIQ
ncbi:RHS repeat-associated core domain-containing protein [Streptomyces sp. ME01-24h]|nr:RHS repeat-associated core domain-containing protein [Streptomyces sp. ME01-24h]